MSDATTAGKGLTHGSAVSSRDADGFTLNEVEYGCGDRYPAHTHDFSYVLLVLSGGFREDVGASEHEGTSGSVVFMPAGVKHVNRIAPHGARGLLVTFPSERPIRKFGWCDRGPASRSMLRLYHLFRSAPRHEQLAVAELLLDVTDNETTRTLPDTAVVKRVVAVLNDSSAEPLRLADVARSAGVTAAYLSRTFRRNMGTTMGDYLRGVRARNAAAMISSSAMPIATIALSAGFADQSHLTRVFRGEFGMTPAAYRKLVR